MIETNMINDESDERGQNEVQVSKKILTIPNLLSFIRVILAVVFVFLFDADCKVKDNVPAIIVLIISGITDFFDGKIARKFNMISEVGKILDPIADKITQGVLAICLLAKYKIMIALFSLFVVKECFMGISGLMVIKKTGKNEGAKWYGKVSTFIFYIAMIALLIFPDIKLMFANIIIGICLAVMLFSFIMYARLYYQLCHEQ